MHMREPRPNAFHESRRPFTGEQRMAGIQARCCGGRAGEHSHDRTAAVDRLIPVVLDAKADLRRNARGYPADELRSCAGREDRRSEKDRRLDGAGDPTLVGSVEPASREPDHTQAEPGGLGSICVADHVTEPDVDRIESSARDRRQRSIERELPERVGMRRELHSLTSICKDVRGRAKMRESV